MVETILDIMVQLVMLSIFGPLKSLTVSIIAVWIVKLVA